MSTIKNNTPSSKLALMNHIKYEHLVAGISGGVTSTLILHPLDLIKIRFAVNDGRTTTVPRYDGLSSAFVTIVKKEGVKGLYRGVTPNVWGSGSAWGFYFLFYNAIKTWIQGGNARTPLGPGLHMLAAAEAGVLSLIMTNPIWVVKTRLCLQYSDEHVVDNRRYKGMVDGLTKIYRTEGVRGLYRIRKSYTFYNLPARDENAMRWMRTGFCVERNSLSKWGFVPGMFGVSHGALQFMTYEEMKNRYNQYRNLPIDIKLTSVEYLTFAAISKLIAAGATYPYQVVRARLQDQHRTYDGAWHCVQETWRHEGWRGFYKGLKPNLVRVVPATMITFLTYENVSHYMLNRGKENLKLPS